MTVIRTLIAGTLLAVGLTANAQEPVFDSAYEVGLEDFRLPASTTGLVTLRECRGCEFITIQADANTVYRLNGEAIQFNDFRRSILLARQRNVQKPVVVLRNLDTNTVRSVSIRF
ncbi:MAG: hypothetical protein AAGA44_16625 [Pseudomonadota bacterium]